MPRFLSKTPQEDDDFRIPAEDPLATAGAGGKGPQYIGALPPGPAPVDGDWFTRLRERWLLTEDSRQGTSQRSTPAAIPRIATLAESANSRNRALKYQEAWHNQIR